MLGFQSDEENPAKAEVVRNYRDGYRAEMRERGVREKRAKVMPESKVNELVEYLNGQWEKTTGIKRSLQCRNGSGHRAIPVGNLGTWERVRTGGDAADRWREG